MTMATTAAGVDAAHFLNFATAVAAAEGQQRAAQQALAAAQAETTRRRGRLAGVRGHRAHAGVCG